MNTEIERKIPMIVYPYAGSVFYQDLGRRLAKACREKSMPVHLCSSAELRDMNAASLQDTTVLIVNPWECVHELPAKTKFYSKLSKAGKRVMVLAEAVGFKWFDAQFKLPITYDSLIDVGFTSQKAVLKDSSLPYSFLFHGLTQDEEERVLRISSFGRPIPWAFVGHRRDDRIQIAAELIEKVDPAGLVFIPNTGQGIREGKGMIGPSGMSLSLARTQCYVWRSLHDLRYYESFRFREAILAGAAPCKIDPQIQWENYNIPGIFGSVEEFAETLNIEGFEALQKKAKDFYISGGRLADHLEEVFVGV